MSKKRDFNLYLKDILDSIKRIEKYTKGLDVNDFHNNDMINDAVVRNLEIIGEAAKNFPAELRRHAPEIPWKKIIGFRNIVVHEYFAVDLSNVWFIVTQQLPILKTQIRSLQKEIKLNH